MDDILASIRRILDEDGATKSPAEDVLMLDASMMIHDPAPGEPARDEPARDESVRGEPAPAGPATPAENATPMASASDDPSPATIVAPLPVAPALAPTSVPREAAAATPASSGAEAAAAQSVGALMRTLAAERRTPVTRGGLTIEDLVREEVRPLLTAWLDTHLPQIVERAVRVEIERIVGRQSG